MMPSPVPVRLSELAAGLERRGDDPIVSAVTEDSRQVGPGTLFVAVRGSARDGHDYIPDAIARGAAAVAAEHADRIPDRVPAVRVESGQRALVTLAARSYGNPERELTLVGFTGTFGKTSTSDILRRLLQEAGEPAGVVGSLGARYGSYTDPGSGLTTPAPPELFRMLRGLRGGGARTAILEVTSHALRLGRLSGLRLDAGLLSAVKSGEHTDFHGTFEDYVSAKRLFLDYLQEGGLLAYDADNDASRALAQSAARRTRLAGFSLQGRHADVTFHDVVLGPDGARFAIGGWLAGARREFSSPLLGAGHLLNVALAITYALAAGVAPDAVSRVLRDLAPMRRRMERYEAAGRTILDDTAAHPESLQATFEVAAMLQRKRMAVVYAVRGTRGTEINRRNADALAALAASAGTAALFVTAAADVAGPQDRVLPEEAEAARDALAARHCGFEWHDDLRSALDAALAATAPGDLIVLVGAQGMNAGRGMLAVSEPASAPIRSARS